jgi:hypothetical protein
MSASQCELLSAAGYLCTAAERLRAAGFWGLAEEVEQLLASLDVEVLLDSLPSVSGTER